METLSDRQAPDVKTVSKRTSLTSLTTLTAAPKMETSDGHGVPLAPSDAGNGSREFPPVCAHCGAPATADAPVQLCAVVGEEVLLHRDCQAGWLNETNGDLGIPEFLRRTPRSQP